MVFVASMAIAVAVGWGLEQVDESDDLGTREALLFVALAWFAVSVVGAVPYVLAGWGTESALAHPVNALFEATSGFTTTGATVTEEISFERHSHALLIWRQATQWLGGMGIIVLMIAILPEAAVNGAQLMDSEAPGPSLQKLTPRIAATARVLWLVYLAFTVLYVLLLLLLHYSGIAPEMNAYNAIAHGFTTLPTGGFSPQAESIAFSPAVQWLVIPFMLVAGVNFALFWHLLNGTSTCSSVTPSSARTSVRTSSSPSCCSSSCSSARPDAGNRRDDGRPTGALPQTGGLPGRLAVELDRVRDERLRPVGHGRAGRPPVRDVRRRLGRIDGRRGQGRPLAGRAEGPPP